MLPKEHSAVDWGRGSQTRGDFAPVGGQGVLLNILQCRGQPPYHKELRSGDPEPGEELPGGVGGGGASEVGTKMNRREERGGSG